MYIDPLNAVDFYKPGHEPMYPDGTNMVVSNLTARSAKLKNIPDEMFLGGTIFFGLQYFMKDFLVDTWNNNFFKLDREFVLKRYKRRMDNALGPNVISVKRMGELHEMGYLPIRIDSVPEATLVPIKVPMLVIRNTEKNQFWLTNYLESVMSCSLWKPTVSATTAFHYRYYLDRKAKKTGGDRGFVKWQMHDFSFRGMSGIIDAALSGAGHLLSFCGSDTCPAIDFLEQYYYANSDLEMIGGSVAASEHSVMSMGIKDYELDTYRRLITTVYPKGILSVVSDTWDFWKVITVFARELKDVIMKREGKVVFRPDSGDPTKIICGDPDAEPESPAWKGALRCLWEIYGGTTNAAGYKVLDPHVGLIYGDSITPSRCYAIVEKMEQMGFCSTNVVFGIGSFTYQCVTRDTYGMAVKATYGEVNSEPRLIFKDPVTDIGGLKKSARGLIRVYRNAADELTFEDNYPTLDSTNESFSNAFLNGVITRKHTLSELRSRIDSQMSA